MWVMSICNQKGGVGKSTTTFHLARSCVRNGKRVLIVDADPQGNISAAVSKDPLPDDAVGLADVLSKRTTMAVGDVIVPGIWDGLSLVPTVGDALSFVRDELVIAGPGRETRLRKALEAVKDDYDVVLIDCPPAVDQLSINALVASDQVVIVSHSRQWSMSGIAFMIETINTVREYYQPNLLLAGAIVNQFEKTTNAAQYWVAELAEAAKTWGFTVFTPYIPKRTMIADCVESATALDECRGGKDLQAVYDELWEVLTNE